MIKLLLLANAFLIGCTTTDYYDCESVSSPDKIVMEKAIQLCYSNASLDSNQKKECVKKVQGSFCELVIVRDGCLPHIIYSPKFKDKIKSGRTYSKGEVNVETN